MSSHINKDGIEIQTKFLTVRIEIPATEPSDQIHDCLCKAIYELDESSLHVLMDSVIDIQIVE